MPEAVFYLLFFFAGLFSALGVVSFTLKRTTVMKEPMYAPVLPDAPPMEDDGSPHNYARRVTDELLSKDTQVEEV